MKSSRIIPTLAALVLTVPCLASSESSPTQKQQVRGGSPASENHPSIAQIEADNADRDLYDVDKISMGEVTTCCSTEAPLVEILTGKDTYYPTTPISPAPSPRPTGASTTLKTTEIPTSVAPTSVGAMPTPLSYDDDDDYENIETKVPTDEPTFKPTNVAGLPSDDYHPTDDDYTDDDYGRVNPPTWGGGGQVTPPSWGGGGYVTPPSGGSWGGGYSSKSSKSSKGSTSKGSKSNKGSKSSKGDVSEYEGANGSGLNRVTGLVEYSEVSSSSGDRAFVASKYYETAIFVVTAVIGVHAILL